MQELNGFVKIHRKLVRWGWYQDNVVKGVFLHLLLTASYKETEWMGRTIHKGQVVVGTQSMAAELGFTRQQIRTAISKLRSTNEITTESTNKYTIVTLINWEEYQLADEFPTSKTTSNLTNKQPADVMNKLLTSVESLKKSTSKSTNKNELQTIINSGIEEIKTILSTSSLTNEQPTNNQQITNKQPHLKNIKNKRNSSDGASAAPLLSDIFSYIREHDLNVDGEKFFQHYTESGWKTKSGKPVTDWRRQLKAWDSMERREKPTYANGYQGVRYLGDPD